MLVKTRQYKWKKWDQFFLLRLPRPPGHILHSFSNNPCGITDYPEDYTHSWESICSQRGWSLHLIHLFSNYKFHVIFVSKILGTPSACTKLTEKENVAPTLNSLKTKTWGKREKCWDSSKRSILSLSGHPHCSWGVALLTVSSSSVAKKW